MSNLLGLVAIIVIMWQIISIGWTGLVNLQINLGTKKRRPIDISHLQLTPPSKTKEIIASLNSLEFHRLGESQLELPIKKSVTVWILINSNNTIQAETGFGRISFSTFFQDNVLVVTDYPNGEHIEMPKYQSHTITSSISDAYQHHLEQVAKFSQKYGSPNIIRNMADYFQWETMGRLNYGSIKLRNFLLVDIVRLATFGYAAIICMTLPLLYRAKFPSYTTTDVLNSQAYIELLIIGLTLPATFVPQLFSRLLKKKPYKKAA